MTKNKRPQKVNKLQIKRLNTWTSTQSCESMDAFYHNREEGWEGKGVNLGKIGDLWFWFLKMPEEWEVFQWTKVNYLAFNTYR